MMIDMNLKENRGITGKIRGAFGQIWGNFDQIRGTSGKIRGAFPLFFWHFIFILNIKKEIKSIRT
jgi:hypothetical protein